MRVLVRQLAPVAPKTRCVVLQRSIADTVPFSARKCAPIRTYETSLYLLKLWLDIAKVPILLGYSVSCRLWQFTLKTELWVIPNTEFAHSQFGLPNPEGVRRQ